MVDFGMAMMTQEYAKQAAKEAEKQQQIDKAVQQDCLDAINKVANDIVSVNPDISEIVTAHRGLENDPQTRRFLEFVATATSFASMKFAERLRNVPELVGSIKCLLIEMMKEIKEFSDIANELQDLIHCFIKLVVNTKQNMTLVIAPLQESIDHMEIIADALSPNSDKSLENRDKEDIELALQGMSCGIEKLLQLARTAKQESSDLDEKINVMKKNIQEKRIVVEGRLEIAKCAPWLEAAGGGFAGFLVGNALIAGPILGGAGAIIIGGVAFPPVLAIIAAALVGGALVGSIVYLVKKLWARHNRKALAYLNEVLKLLVKLSDANLYFCNYMARAEAGASKILNETSQIQRTITSGSQRYRKINARICTEAIQSTNEMITCIKEIVQIDMSEWSSSSAVLSFASSSSKAESSIKAIKN